MNRETVRRDYWNLIKNSIKVRSIRDLSLYGVNFIDKGFTNEEIKELDVFNDWKIYIDEIGVLILNVSNLNCLNEEIDLFIKFLKALKNVKHLVLDDTSVTSKNLLLILEICSSLENLEHVSAIQKKYDSDQQYFSELK